MHDSLLPYMPYRDICVAVRLHLVSERSELLALRDARFGLGAEFESGLLGTSAWVLARSISSPSLLSSHPSAKYHPWMTICADAHPRRPRRHMAHPARRSLRSRSRSNLPCARDKPAPSPFSSPPDGPRRPCIPNRPRARSASTCSTCVPA